MKRAVYAGSFDPPTNGHLWMIAQASKMFDEVIVAIGINPDKKYTFTTKERIDMLKKSFIYNNVKVDTFDNEFLVRYAEKVNAQYIIRGIRSQIDFEYEKQMRNVNTEISPKVDTIFLIPPRDLADISSSFVKGLIGPLGWESMIEKYVPPSVASKIFEKNGCKPKKESKNITLKTICEYYNNNNLPYHNWGHIEHCIREYEDIKILCEDPISVWLALLYHDSVYDTIGVNNEERSARLFLKDFPNYPNRFKVQTMIEATKRHDVIDSTIIGENNDLAYVIDIDLAILGSDYKTYNNYVKSIREEFDCYGDEEFYKGRMRFLTKYLEKENIYHTKYFRNKYEEKARDNMLTEYSNIKGKVQPEVNLHRRYGMNEWMKCIHCEGVLDTGELRDNPKTEIVKCRNCGRVEEIK